MYAALHQRSAPDVHSRFAFKLDRWNLHQPSQPLHDYLSVRQRTPNWQARCAHHRLKTRAKLTTPRARSRVRRHLEPMVHTPQISTTRTLPALQTTTNRGFHRTLPILYYRQTVSIRTTSTEWNDSSELTYVHVHESTTAHARTADTSGTTRLRNLSSAQPPTIIRDPTTR